MPQMAHMVHAHGSSRGNRMAETAIAPRHRMSMWWTCRPQKADGSRCQEGPDLGVLKMEIP